ncbi:uncharacterized protein BYT42DRAFT_586492 [Radiomyces spectabilis]|uniref:uncharacterized protein n=1 Tax=Radiomyces spectabilis TaxID=64574 RepID=UPI002220F988|nr:uncharacterized protein BYT42DRAFT_586492 [Radiomyces spectabilis]KAI8367497.1 hypothetical protein BYT42DRAFT_586492 [Radiomyces spectabilis]
MASPQKTEPISILKSASNIRSGLSDTNITANRTTRIVLSEDEDDDYVQETGHFSDGEDDDPCAMPVSGEALELLKNEKVVKAGYLMKKGEKRRRTWKKRWFVLRTTKMALYKDSKEYKLLRIIDLHEIHSVVQVTSKNKYKFVFAIITPKRMYYVQAKDQADMDGWFDAIERTKAELKSHDEDDSSSVDRDQEFAKDVITSYKSNHTANMMQQRRRSSGATCDTPTRRPSGGGVLPGSSASDKPTSHVHVPPVDIPKPQRTHPQSSPAHVSYTPQTPLSEFATGHIYPLSPNSEHQAHVHMAEGLASSEDDEEYSWHSDMANVCEEESRNRVLIEGYLLKLGRNKGWRKRWFVLRPETLAYYEDDKEYAPHRIIPLTHIIDSLEIEPISKHKRYCFKIIIPKRNYVLCANTEVDLESWLNALSVAVRRAKKESGEVKPSSLPKDPQPPCPLPASSRPLSQIPENGDTYSPLQRLASGSSVESFENTSHISGVSGAGGVGGAGGALGGAPTSSGIARLHSRASERLGRAK